MRIRYFCRKSCKASVPICLTGFTLIIFSILYGIPEIYTKDFDGTHYCSVDTCFFLITTWSSPSFDNLYIAYISVYLNILCIYFMPVCNSVQCICVSVYFTRFCVFPLWPSFAWAVNSAEHYCKFYNLERRLVRIWQRFGVGLYASSHKLQWKFLLPNNARTHQSIEI